MANHASAKKRIRTTAKRTDVNASRMNRIRSFIRKVETAITSGDVKAAENAFKIAQPELARGAAKGLMHAKTASRMLSRISSRIKALKA